MPQRHPASRSWPRPGLWNRAWAHLIGSEANAQTTSCGGVKQFPLIGDGRVCIETVYAGFGDIVLNVESGGTTQTAFSTLNFPDIAESMDGAGVNLLAGKCADAALTIPQRFACTLVHNIGFYNDLNEDSTADNNELLGTPSVDDTVTPD